MPSGESRSIHSSATPRRPTANHDVLFSCPEPSLVKQRSTRDASRAAGTIRNAKRPTCSRRRRGVDIAPGFGRVVALWDRRTSHDTCTVFRLLNEKVSLLQHCALDLTSFIELALTPALESHDANHPNRARHDGIRITRDEVRPLCASNWEVSECQHGSKQMSSVNCRGDCYRRAEY